MLLGYNTNGLAHHDAASAVDLLAEIGYRSVALTLDHGMLNPYGEDVLEQLAAMRDRLDRNGMRCVIETGARFLLDHQVKHEPTLLSSDSAGRDRRIDFLSRAIIAAKTLGADCVSLWSGILRDEANDSTAWARLTEGLSRVLDVAAEHNVTIGFEPEPGMFIDTMARFEELLDRIDSPHLQLTLDLGHLHCQDETPIADVIRRWSSRLVNVHIEDMRRGVHEHLMFGEGEIDFPPILAALAEVGYAGGLHVELSRHSHDGPNAARQAFRFLVKLSD
jgi:sugar phosphate isomerase/epimerase